MVAGTLAGGSLLRFVTYVGANPIDRRFIVAISDFDGGESLRLTAHCCDL